MQIAPSFRSHAGVCLFAYSFPMLAANLCGAHLLTFLCTCLLAWWVYWSASSVCEFIPYSSVQLLSREGRAVMLTQIRCRPLHFRQRCPFLHVTATVHVTYIPCGQYLNDVHQLCYLGAHSLQLTIVYNGTPHLRA